MTEIIHCHEYVEVPVLGIVPVAVRAWFASRMVALTVGAAGAARAEWTVTVDEGADVCDSATEALSVTLSSNA